MANFNSAIGFHDQGVASNVSVITEINWDTQFTYKFENFFHPFVGELISKLNKDSLPGMLDAAELEKLKTPDPIADPANDFFHLLYHPNNSHLVKVNSFSKEIDVSEHGSYANYNWELFFHIPLTVAVHLSKTQRFAEAQRWFH
ncbi:MAG TPA: toxin, partial [Blastocatellia bacterium]|nr:toxin [Blastocatellia bacterium]